MPEVPGSARERFRQTLRDRGNFAVDRNRHMRNRPHGGVEEAEYFGAVPILGVGTNTAYRWDAFDPMYCPGLCHESVQPSFRHQDPVAGPWQPIQATLRSMPEDPAPSLPSNDAADAGLVERGKDFRRPAPCIGNFGRAGRKTIVGVCWQTNSVTFSPYG